MYRSRPLFAAIAAAAMLAASAFACAFERVRERVVDAFHAVIRFAFGVAPAPVRADQLDPKASRLLTAASLVRRAPGQARTAAHRGSLGHVPFDLILTRGSQAR